jgi:tetratricopeptide (TPR) repeat protein
MGKFTLLIVVLFLIALSYFATQNKEHITVTITPSLIYEMPKIALILLSSGVGAALMLLFFFIRDTRRFILSRQYQRKQKRDMKIQELYSKALNAILADNNEEAQGALEGILQEEPGHLYALLRLGDVAAGDEDYHKAIEYYKKANEIQPQNLEVLFSLERMMEKTDRSDESLFYLDEILKEDPDNLNALYRKRSILEKSDKWDEIIQIQKAIIKIEHHEKDRDREKRNLLGCKYEEGRYSLESGNLEKAEKAFKTVVRMDRNFVPAYLGHAEVMLRKGDTTEAVAYLEKAYEQTSSMIILARIEDLLINVGEPARLIRLYTNSISKDPRNQTLKFFVGKLYYRLEMLDDAFDTLTTVDEGGELYPELHYLLGNIYLRRRQCERSVEEFKKVIETHKPFRLPYCCGNCGHLDQGWSGRCPSCKAWNTYQFDLYGTCKP